jgi:hypothetical protein
VYQDLNDAAGRKALGFAPDASDALDGSLVVPLRATAGEDASCLNLQRPTAPRVLGVPHELVERGGFVFAAHRPLPAGQTNPWRLLEQAPPDGYRGEAVPAFADEASAQWILKVGLGDELEVPDGRGGTVRLRLAGLLTGSIFQSELLISEASFRRHFGSEGGARAFLIETPPGREQAVADALRQGLCEWGLDVQRTADVLAAYGRVQNTYLSTFETLGGLGLLLGTFGLVAVLLRSVLERRSELAMMQALGFRRRTIFAKILLENVWLLLLGVGIGTAAALVAVAPHLLSTVADVRWPSLAATLGACILVGLGACAAAAASAMRGRLMDALRSE